LKTPSNARLLSPTSEERVKDKGRVYFPNSSVFVIFQVTNVHLLSPPSEERVKGKGRMYIPNSTVFYSLFN
jgi:hypothetical protein